MKTLVLVRHGKSSWDMNNIADVDRPLKAKGIRNNMLIAEKLKEHDILPDLLISSPATRAIHTAILFAKGIGYNLSNIKIDELIYSEGEDDVMSLIENTSDDINILMLVGHNPTFTNLANFFSLNPIDNLPTSGTIIFKLDIDKWNLINSAKTQDEILEYPKKYT